MKIQKVAILKFNTSDIFLEEKYNLKITYGDNTSSVYSYSSRSMSAQIGLLNLTGQSKVEFLDNELTIYTPNHHIVFRGLTLLTAPKEAIKFTLMDYYKYDYKLNTSTYGSIYGRTS